MAESKDFGPIRDDYRFFEDHATEAAEDSRAYAEVLRPFLPAGPVRLLDFGCGAGNFTERLLDALGLPPERVSLTLVEPQPGCRCDAAGRLSARCRDVTACESLPVGLTDAFDAAVSNHVLYYVPDLDDALGRIHRALTPGGVFATAVAGEDNELIRCWRAGFGAAGRPVPYHTLDDVTAALGRLGVPFARRRVNYTLAFDDAAERRRSIARFLFGEYLAVVPEGVIEGWFDRFVTGERVVIHTGHDHLLIRKGD